MARHDTRFLRVVLKGLFLFAAGCFFAAILAYLFAISPLQSELREREQDLARCLVHSESLQVMLDSSEEAKNKIEKILSTEQTKVANLRIEFEDERTEKQRIRDQFSTLDHQCNTLDTRLELSQEEATKLSSELKQCVQDLTICQQNQTTTSINASHLQHMLDLELANVKKCIDQNQQDFQALESMKRMLGQQEHQLRVLNNENFLCFDRLEALETEKKNREAQVTPYLQPQAVAITATVDANDRENEEDTKLFSALEVNEDTRAMGNDIKEDQVTEENQEESVEVELNSRSYERIYKYEYDRENEEDTILFSALEVNEDTLSTKDLYLSMFSEGELDQSTEEYVEQEEYLEELLQQYLPSASDLYYTESEEKEVFKEYYYSTDSKDTTTTNY